MPSTQDLLATRLHIQNSDWDFMWRLIWLLMGTVGLTQTFMACFVRASAFSISMHPNVSAICYHIAEIVRNLCETHVPSFQLNHVKMCNAQLRQLLFCFRLNIKDVLLGRKQTVWFDIPIASVAWGWLNYSSINWWGWAFLIRQRSSSMTDCVANAARNSVTITVPLQILHLATFYVVGHVCMLKVDPKIADALMSIATWFAPALVSTQIGCSSQWGSSFQIWWKIDVP